MDLNKPAQHGAQKLNKILPKEITQTKANPYLYIKGLNNKWSFIIIYAPGFVKHLWPSTTYALSMREKRFLNVINKFAFKIYRTPKAACLSVVHARILGCLSLALSQLQKTLMTEDELI